MALERASDREISPNELPQDLDLLKLWSDSGSSWSLLEREACFQMRCQHLQQEESRWRNWWDSSLKPSPLPESMGGLTC